MELSPGGWKRPLRKADNCTTFLRRQSRTVMGKLFKEGAKGKEKKKTLGGPI